jgi:hypothetical protein
MNVQNRNVQNNKVGPEDQRLAQFWAQTFKYNQAGLPEHKNPFTSAGEPNQLSHLAPAINLTL